MNVKIKTLIKRCFDYTIEDEYRVFRLKRLPVRIRVSLTRSAVRKYGQKNVNPRMVVLHNYMGSGYGCNCKYVTEELLRRHADVDLVWIVRNVQEQKENFPSGIRLVEYGTKEALQAYFDAAVWVCNYHLNAYWNMGLEKRPGQTYIQMWHGSLGIKRLERDCDLFRDMPAWGYLAQKNSVNTDIWVSNSTFETEVYQSAFWGVRNIKPLGHPRNDVFFLADDSGIRKAVRDALQLEKEHHAVLYVPTYRESGAFPAGKLVAERLMNALARRFGGVWDMLVRCHPRMQNGVEDVVLHGGVGDPAGESMQGVNMQNRIVDATAYPDIQELLVYADVVITDYSSCIFDYMLSGRPAFIYAPDLEQYNTERGFYYPLEETPFAIAKNMDILEERIATFDQHVYAAEVERFLASKGCMEDGQAARRVADLIMEVIDHPEFEK